MHEGEGKRKSSTSESTPSYNPYASCGIPCLAAARCVTREQKMLTYGMHSNVPSPATVN